MRLKDLNTYCVESFLSSASDYDVTTFRNAFPRHDEAVMSLWACRTEVNVDHVLTKHIPVLLPIIKSRKLKKVTFRRRRPEGFSNEIRSAIFGNCSELEYLDIPQLELSREDVRLLSSCVTLKYLNIWYDDQSTEFVEQVVANNPRLEEIRLNGQVTNDLFKNLPETIKGIELLRFQPHIITNFWNRLQTWQVEKLDLTGTFYDLRFQHVILLSTQTKLKYLSIQFEMVGNSLANVFRKNPGLEEVRLDSFAGQNGADLKYLPPSLKCLTLQGTWQLDSNDFAECVKTWNLHSFVLRDASSHHNLMVKVLEVAPHLSKLDVTWWNILNNQNFDNCEVLRRLKVLRLASMDTENTNSLKNLLQNCVRLEKLIIELTVLDYEIIAVISALPKLREFYLHQGDDIEVDYFDHMHGLSRSTSLTSIHLHYVHGLPEADILTIIRGCRTLKNLTLEMCATNRFIDYEIFLKYVVMELEQQLERRDVLTIEISPCTLIKKRIFTIDWHPMLNVTFLNESCETCDS